MSLSSSGESLCARLRRRCCPGQSSADDPQTPAEAHKEIRRLRHRLFAFIYNKQKPMNYTLMIRYLLHWKVSVYSLVPADRQRRGAGQGGRGPSCSVIFRKQERGLSCRLKELDEPWDAVGLADLVNRRVRSEDIPTMGTTALRIEAIVFNNGQPRRAEKIRLTMSRYLNLAWLLYMWKVSEKIKQRFRMLRNLISETNRFTVTHLPGMRRSRDHLENSSNFDMRHFRVDGGQRLYPALQRIVSEREDIREQQIELLIQDLVLLNQDPVIQENYGEIITPSEIAVFEERARQARGPYSIEYELPMHWAVAVAQQALAEGFICTYEAYRFLLGTFSDWSSLLSTVNKYANKNLPLVYTQVVIIAVYTWFFIEVVAAQTLLERHGPLNATTPDGGVPDGQIPYVRQYWTDLYVPVFALVKLLFVLGWFKVAFILMDPYAADVDDLPFSDILNSNLRKGRNLAGFPVEFYPKKLRRAMEGDGPPGNYLHSDEELTQELKEEQLGPWREPEPVQPEDLPGTTEAVGATGTSQPPVPIPVTSSDDPSQPLLIDP
uniref:Bestrophin homolog n=1 Tax=Macrostomum lignano TaxID=282301 RepID=A0A1I8I9S4_9PLAT